MYFYVFLNDQIIDELFVNHVSEEEINSQTKELLSKHGEDARVEVSAKRIFALSEA